MDSENWPTRRVREVTTKVGSGATPPGGSNSYKDEGISLIRSLNVYDLHFDVSGLALIDDEQAARLANVEVLPGDVLLNITGASVARCCLVPADILPARVNQHVAIVRPDQEQLDSHFLAYLLVSRYHKARLLAIAQGGATREALTKQKIEDFDVPLPPLNSQRRIAAALASYDELIENNLRRIEILEQMAQAIYREWFVEFRYPGHEADELVDSPTGPIPEGWRFAVIKDICNRIQAGSTPLRSNPGFWDEGGVDWYKTGELHDGFLLESEEHVSSDAPIRMFDPGTILMAIYGSPTVGRMGIVVQPSSANQAALGLVPDPNQLGSILLFHLLLDRRAHFNSIAQGAAQQNISKAKVESTGVLLPRREVASAFEELLQPHWGLRLNLARQNANLRTARDLLIPKLISGEIDVSDLDIDTSWLAA